ncbi:MAG: choice-of-anchor Q domain-containing protein [Rudaea sp.]
MKSPIKRFISRPTPLAACLTAVLALTSPAAATAATTWTVTSCSETTSGSSTSGTLRYVLANAASGDTVDMTSLACSNITLKTGALRIDQSDLTLNGPGKSNLVISGKYNFVAEPDRIIDHEGTGILVIKDMSLAFGNPSSASLNVYGGCIYSKGSVVLNNADVYLCQATVSGLHTAAGGGVFIKGSLLMKYSEVAGNYAKGGSNSLSIGGGAKVDASLISKYSGVFGNSAITSGSSGFGGGVSVGGSVTMKSSTISSNSANRNAGVDIFSGAPASNSVSISNSTISGNDASVVVGGLYSNAPSVLLRNSTIAFNTAGTGRLGASFPFSYYAPGMATRASSVSISVNMQSSLLSNNTYGNDNEDDFSKVDVGASTVTFNAASANNFIRASFATLPAGTLRFSCPLLGPLRDNGGLNETHALLSHSPAIDVGNNTVTALGFDERGSPFARVDHGTADIGAYEVQQLDVVFNTSFEGCPLLF